jgi:hypothetical protein
MIDTRVILPLKIGAVDGVCSALATGFGGVSSGEGVRLERAALILRRCAAQCGTGPEDDAKKDKIGRKSEAKPTG